MLHRSFLTILFAVLLMFGQQQAMVHGYVHANDLQQTSSDEGKSTSHSELCGKCVSLAGLGAALVSQAPALNIDSGHFRLSTELHKSIVSQRVLTYHSRAPPQINSI